MAFYPFEVTIPHIIYACLGGFIVLFGMFSLFLRERLYISEACWAFLFGIIVGPYCADIFNPRAWVSEGSDQVLNVITLEFTRVILAIGVFAIGVELPKAYMRRHWKSLFFLLVPVMTWGWLVSAAFIYALIPGLNFLTSLAVAACLTPTDPILAAAVIGGKWADKHVPAHIRHLLAAESGCNDGAAFPFLFLSLYLLFDHPDTGAAIRDWFLLLWLYQIVLAVVIGTLIGFAFRHLMKFGERMNLIDRHSYVAQYISLAIFTIGVCTLLGSDDLLAAFACGTAFAWDGFFNKQTEESVFSSVIDLLFNIAAFIYVGAWMPFDKFQDAELTLSVWRLLVIAILVLLFRRLPIMIAVYRWIPDVKNFREAVFSGHFGPIGIGAVFISTLAVEIIHHQHKTAENATNYHEIEMLLGTIQPIVAFMVLCSITIHGLSIPGFSLGRRVHSVSRTWSRHATATSGGLAQPEWTNQARLVSRGDAKIVINRDDGVDVDLERGVSDSEKTREGSGASFVDLEKENPLEVALDGNGGMFDSAPAQTEVRFADSDNNTRQSTLVSPSLQQQGGAAASSSAVEIQAPPRVYVPKSRFLGTQETESPVEDGRQGSYAGGSGATSPGGDWREENYPDGGRMRREGEGDEITEWREGDQRVIERRAGPGEDVEVTVIHDPLPRTDETTGERLEHRVSKELVAFAEHLHHAGRKAKEVVVGSPTLIRTGTPSGQATEMKVRMRRTKSGEKGKQPASGSGGFLAPGEVQREGSGSGSSASGTLPTSILITSNNEDDEEGWSSEGSVMESLSGGEGASTTKVQSRRAKIGGHFKNIVMGKRRRGQSFRRDNVSTVQETEEVRGRAAAVSSSGSGSQAQQSQPRPQQENQRPQHQHHHQRLGSSAVSPRPGMEVRHSRVGRIVSDSRAPTRDSSPSRSIRFQEGVRTPRYGGGGTESPKGVLSESEKNV